MRASALGLALAASVAFAGCHSWGFFRPADTPPLQETVEPSGLRWSDLRRGEGPAAVRGARVSVHYTGFIAGGAKFDSSLDRGTPFEFVLGEGRVIRGWDEGMLGMQVGGRRRLTIPPELAYGSEGRAGAIPPDATLVLEVELLELVLP